MKKKYRIKKNADFQKVFQNKDSVANRQFVVYKLKNDDHPHFRIGISVSKKLGNAVTRNKIKRYIREVIHEFKEEIDPAYDYVIIARKPVVDMTYHEVKKSLRHVLKVARVLNQKKED